MSSSLENLGTENRKFPPTPEFAAAANAKADMYGEAKADRLAFWEKQAHALHWDEPWTQVLDWKRPFAKWFIGGKLNASYNCLDRHVIEGRGDRVAFIFEGEPGDSRTYTYAQLLIEVKKTANALIKLGVKDGDILRVSNGHGAISLPALVEDIHDDAVWVPRNSFGTQTLISLNAVHGDVVTVVKA